MDKKTIAGLKKAQKKIEKLGTEEVTIDENEPEEVRFLSDKERQFCEKYVTTGVVNQAAKHANICRHIGYRLVNSNNYVKAYIKYLRNVRKTNTILEHTECCELLSEIAKDKLEKTDSRIKAVQELSKLKGFYEQAEGQTTVVQVLGLQAWNQGTKAEDEKQDKI